MSEIDGTCDVCPSGRGLHLVLLGDEPFFLCGGCTDFALESGAEIVVVAS